MVKKFKSWLNILFLTLVLIIPGLVFATSTQSIISPGASPMDRLENAATDKSDGKSVGPFSQTADEFTLAKILGMVITVALSILGIIFIFITIVSGFKWMSSQGNEEEIKKAQGSLKNAIIGRVVILSSYAVWTFIKNVFSTKI